MNETLSKLGYPVLPLLLLESTDLQKCLIKQESEAEPSEDSEAVTDTSSDNDSPSKADPEQDTEVLDSSGDLAELSKERGEVMESQLLEAEMKLVNKIAVWISENRLNKEEQAFVVKPAYGSFSAGVSAALSVQEILEGALQLFAQVFPSLP